MARTVSRLCGDSVSKLRVLHSGTQCTHLDDGRSRHVAVELEQVTSDLLGARFAQARRFKEEVVADVGSVNRSRIEDGKLADACSDSRCESAHGRRGSSAHCVSSPGRTRFLRVDAAVADPLTTRMLAFSSAL